MSRWVCASEQVQCCRIRRDLGGDVEHCRESSDGQSKYRCPRKRNLGFAEPYSVRWRSGGRAAKEQQHLKPRRADWTPSLTVNLVKMTKISTPAVTDRVAH